MDVAVGICMPVMVAIVTWRLSLVGQALRWRRWEPEMEAAGLAREHWRKSSMWSMLLRKHAQAVVDDWRCGLHCVVVGVCCSAAGSGGLSAGLACWGCAVGLGAPLALRVPAGWRAAQ